MTNIQSVKLQSYMGSTDITCLIITKTNGRVIYVPQSDGNRDYQEYLEWLAKGNTPQPYVAPPEPEPLTAQQKLENVGLTVDELKTLLGI